MGAEFSFGDVYKLYGKYYDVVQRVGKFRLTHDIKLEELNLSNSMKRKAYRDMEKIMTVDTGDLIDLFCFISTDYLVSEVWKKMVNLEEVGSLKITRYILNNNDYLVPDVVNLLRLFFRNPWHYFGFAGHSKIMEDLQDKFPSYDEVCMYGL